MANFDSLKKVIGSKGVAGDLKSILKAVGALVTSESQKSFDEQSFFGFDWPGRYENQTPFTINVAGALTDLNKSGEINIKRFQNRPAGLDSGNLRNSINWQITKDNSVEIGSALPYASTINFGGRAKPIPVTDQARKGLAKFLKKKKKEERKRFSRQVGFLFQKDEYTAKVNPRPFIVDTKKRLPKQLHKDIAELVRIKLEGGLG